MKKIMLLIAGLVLGLAGQFGSALALSPAQHVSECFGNDGIVEYAAGVDEVTTQLITRPCIMVNCEWDNTAKNWPEDSGYNVDCDNTLIQIRGYSGDIDGGSCAALTPSCGYCPGVAEPFGCFLTPTEFIEYFGVFDGLQSKALVDVNRPSTQVYPLEVPITDPSLPTAPETTESLSWWQRNQSDVTLAGASAVGFLIIGLLVYKLVIVPREG